MNVERILEELDRSGLDAGTQAAVVNAVTAGMREPEPNGPSTVYNRKQRRAASAWLRRALGRQARRRG
jgi:hypothetical protein